MIRSLPRPFAQSLTFLLAAGLLGVPEAARASASWEAQPRREPRASTPELIDRAVGRGEINRGRGLLYLAYALAAHDKVPPPFRSTVPWDGTLPLLTLRRDAGTIEPGPERREVQQILSDASGTINCGENSDPLPSVRQSTHFFVEHGAIGGGLTIDDYVGALETSWTTEIDAFGWAAPPVKPSNPPPGNRYHVRVEDLGNGLYGFVTNSGDHAGLIGDNPATSWNEGDAYATCMVVNNNFDRSGFPSTPQASLESTAAHELNHSIQFGYGALHGANESDPVFIEGGATWMEDEVFDAANDSYHYLWPDFDDSMGEYPGSPYKYWITWRGLTERYGTGTAGTAEQVMQDFWEETSRNTGDNLTAIQTALANRGTTLADAFHAYAIAVKFNRACGGGYAVPHCFEEGPGYVSTPTAGPTAVHKTVTAIGNSISGTVEDNYALNWVALPIGSGAFDATLSNMSGAGGALRGSVVCDTGSSLTVRPFPGVVGPGGVITLERVNPSGCTELVAVVTNESQTAANPLTSQGRSYTLATSVPTAARLVVMKGGSGTGTVASDGSGINCGGDCFHSSTRTDTVVLTATPDAGSAFAGWSGDCTGPGTCTVTLDSHRSVTATFSRLFSLVATRSGTGGGTVTSDAPGIACGADCSQAYPDGTTVTLTATPDATSTFGGWSGGGCAGVGTCRVTLGSDTAVTGRFEEAIAPAAPAPSFGGPFQLRRRLPISWGVADAESYDVRYRRARFDGVFGPPVAWLKTPATRATFEAAPGYTYCFSARAADALGNSSAFGEEGCTGVPAGRSAFAHRGSWAKKRGPGHYLGSFSQSTRRGSELVLRGVRAKRLAIIVTRCPGCGTIRVSFAGRVLRTLRLGAPSVRKMRLIGLGAFRGIRTGAVRVRVLSEGRPVKVEGLGATLV